MYQLEFDKPVRELEAKIQKLKDTAKMDESLKAEITELGKELTALKKIIYSNLNGWQKVQLSRHPDRPHSLDYINGIATSFMEMHGDRRAGDDKAIIGGFASLEGQTIMFIGHQKGRNIKENQYRNFGMANPEGYRKALRLMKLAEKFNKPVVSFIDTPGASTGLLAEERGQAEAIATNIQEMLKLKVPVLAIIIGEGAAGGALAIAVADRLLMLENTWFSIIAPEICASVLWKSADYKEEAAIQMKLTANDLLQTKIIDGIVKEPLCGAHTDYKITFKNVKNAIIKNIEEIRQVAPEDRIKQRIQKYTSIGYPTTRDGSK